MFCNLNEIKDVKIIEGIWVIHSVSSKDEVFYPKGKSPLVDYYVFNSDSTGTKKKLKPNFNKNYSSSLDEINFEIKRIDGLIYLNYISNSENWKERIKKLTKNELIISNNKFDYHYKRFKVN
tara:strand:- start:854 stop:1219 length:366 start_codon:yes stop_codon:yes gene_type:complete